jgi:hypothetical protein
MAVSFVDGRQRPAEEYFVLIASVINFGPTPRVAMFWNGTTFVETSFQEAHSRKIFLPTAASIRMLLRFRLGIVELPYRSRTASSSGSNRNGGITYCPDHFILG